MLAVFVQLEALGICFIQLLVLYYQM